MTSPTTEFRPPVASPMSGKRTPANTCGGCLARWGGVNTSHCAGCHQTFTASSAFDQHRRSGGCLTPAEVGLVEKPRAGYTAWGSATEWEGIA